MKTFQIVYRTENFCSVVSSYAENEWMVDFLHDDKAAVFCTAAFCAVELKNYLLKIEFHNDSRFRVRQQYFQGLHKHLLGFP